MSQNNDKLRMRVRSLVKAMCLSSLLLGAQVYAEVTLTSAVKKVETYVDDDGSAARRMVNADSVIPGDELRYTITFSNKGDQVADAGSVVITNPIPPETAYVEGTAFGAGTDIVFSADGGQTFATPEALLVVRDGVEIPADAKDYTTIRWVFNPELRPGETGDVSFNVRLK